MFLSGLVTQGRKETILLFLALLAVSVGEGTDSQGEERDGGGAGWGMNTALFRNEEKSSCLVSTHHVLGPVGRAQPRANP
jgi:hypothetical protein